MVELHKTLPTMKQGKVMSKLSHQRLGLTNKQCGLTCLTIKHGELSNEKKNIKKKG
jgi:hypothetical protein